jgi:hypothetical protein
LTNLSLATVSPAEVARHAADDVSPQVLEMVIATGNLKDLTPTQRLMYYDAVCKSMGLNPLTRPFEFVVLSGQLRMYANKGCAEQLRQIRKISLGRPQTEVIDGAYTVWVEASTPDGRTDHDMGAITITGLQGENKSNAMMKAITKAKRRVTLSICGMGMPDDSEIESIPGARRVKVDAHGEIMDAHLVNAQAQLPAPPPSGPTRKEAAAALAIVLRAIESPDRRNYWKKVSCDLYGEGMKNATTEQILSFTEDIKNWVDPEGHQPAPMIDAEFKDAPAATSEADEDHDDPFTEN